MNDSRNSFVPLLVLKSFIYFVFPRHGAKMLARVSMDRSWEFVLASVLSLGISGLLMFSLIQSRTEGYVRSLR